MQNSNVNFIQYKLLNIMFININLLTYQLGIFIVTLKAKSNKPFILAELDKSTFRPKPAEIASNQISEQRKSEEAL